MIQTKERNSSLELYRIIVMFFIVAHHYVVNSGLMNCISEQPFSKSSLFLLLFGMWGKTGINCFVLITGYFMCTSQITLKKFLKLLLQIEFYKIIIYFIFLSTGTIDFTIKECVKALLPVSSVKSGFVSCFILFYLCIPFLNILIKNLNKTMHRHLLLLCLGIYTLLGTANIPIDMNYVTWFCILFFIGSYIRLYSEDFKYINNSGGGNLSLFSPLVVSQRSDPSVVVRLFKSSATLLSHGIRLQPSVGRHHIGMPILIF